MRLVLFSDPDLPDPEGSFRPAHRLAAELRARACRVLHATLRETGRPPLERVDGITVRRLGVAMPGEGALARAAFRLGARWAMRRWLAELRERPPALIHAHLSAPAVHFAAQAAGELGIPWALTALGSGAPGALRSAARRGGIARLLATCSAVAAPSAEALQRIGRWVPPGAARAVIPPGVEAILAGLPEEPLVLGIGPQEPERGFDGLLRAFVGIHRRRPDARLLLAGAGSESHRLSALEKSLPPPVRESIRREGMPAPERSAKLMQMARVVAFPDRGPGAEITIAAAMAAGRPVVVTRAAGFPEPAIDGGNALVVPPDDAAALGEAVLSLLEDRALAGRIGRAGQGDMVRHSAWTSVAASYLDLFRSVTGVAGAVSR